MTPAELRPIVDAHVGIRPFAALIETPERTVYGWLDGKRRMKRNTAKLIRGLAVGD